MTTREQRYGWLCRELRIATETGDRRGMAQASAALEALEVHRHGLRFRADHTHDAINLDWLGGRHADHD